MISQPTPDPAPLRRSFSLFDDQPASISFSQPEIIGSIMRLYTGHRPFDLDPCFNRGTMYGTLPRPRLRFDLNPRVMDCQQGDARYLSLQDASIDSAIIDPPFLIGGSGNTMSDRYGSYPTLADLQSDMNLFLLEMHRILSTSGILVFKCQDQIHDRRKYFVSLFVTQQAMKIGFNLIDEFLFLSKVRHQVPTENPAASRVYHSKFLVFRKRKGSRQYTLEQ